MKGDKWTPSTIARPSDFAPVIFRHPASHLHDLDFGKPDVIGIVRQIEL
jgi:hypothetical protein